MICYHAIHYHSGKQQQCCAHELRGNLYYNENFALIKDTTIAQEKLEHEAKFEFSLQLIIFGAGGFLILPGCLPLLVIEGCLLQQLFYGF